MKDSIDFKNTDVSTLFRQLLVPTVIGMVFSAIFNITDGVFVGKGIGADALAAVNFIAPVYIFFTAVGLMFGSGGAIVASINLACKKNKVANINITQAMLSSTLIMMILSVLIFIFRVPVARMMGASDDVMPLVLEYLVASCPFLIFTQLINTVAFFIRLDGAPKFAMTGLAFAAVLNIILDYIFIFIFKWGMTGAAVATGIGTGIGTIMMLLYFAGFSKSLKIGRLKTSAKSLRLTLRNTGYMLRVGFPAFLNEMAIASMMVCGNFVFIRYLGTAGVAAFSVVCYLFPIIFMVYNAVGQSAQPIVSFNHGLGNTKRKNEAALLALKTVTTIGAVLLIATIVFKEQIISLFLNSSSPAYSLAVNGIVYFAVGYVFFGANIVAISYYQSIKKVRLATTFTLLRGYILLICSFILLPLIFGVKGIWLSVPAAEILTLVFIGGSLLQKR